MKTSALLGFAALTIMTASPAQAEPYTYEPKGCEFKITFPEKPYMQQKCTSGEDKKCTEVVTYTKVLSAESSVDFRITCDALNEDEHAAYTPEALEASVRDMAQGSNVDVNDIQSSAKDGYRVAAMVSLGMRGEREIFYTGQSWLGKTSLFRIEANMQGPQDDKTDKLFTEILKSMAPKDAARKTEKPAASAKP